MKTFRFALLFFTLQVRALSVSARMPLSLAETVEERLALQSPTHVIHIQDLHEQIAAQTNLSEILLRLDAQAALKGKKLLVAVEGASGDVDVDSLKALSDPKNREAVAAGLLKAGYLFGEEYAALQSETGRIRLVGVDDAALYQKNIMAKDNARRFRLVRTDIQNLKKQLRGLIEHTFNKSLTELESTRIRFSEGSLTLGAYIEFLSQRNAGLVKTYPALAHVLEIHKEEQRLDFEAIDREREIVLKAARKKKDPNAWAHLMEDAIAFRDGHMSALEYYSSLQPDLAWSPSLYRYLAYLEKAERIQSDPAFRDVATVADMLAKKQIKHRTGKELYRHLRWIENQDYFYSLQMTSEEWSTQQDVTFEENQKMLLKVCGFVKEQMEGIGAGEVSVSASSKNFRDAFEAAACFYRLAEERNTALFNNLVRVMGEESSKADIVLIAGGFHTRGLTKLLKAKKIGTTVLRPQLETMVVLPEGISYPAYVKNTAVPRDVQFVRAQGGLFAEGGVEFVRRLLLDATRQISDRMWPRKLGSERSAALLARWKLALDWSWRWVSAAIPGVRLLEGNETGSTYVGASIADLVRRFGEQSKALAQGLDGVANSATPINDPAYLLIDVDSFGAGEIESQGAPWMTFLGALHERSQFHGNGRAQVVFYSKEPRLKVQTLLAQNQSKLDGFSFAFVVKGEKSLRDVLVASGADMSAVQFGNTYHLTQNLTAAEDIQTVSVRGVPHLALATFVYSRFKDAPAVLNNLVRLFESLTPLKMSDRLSSQILATLLAQLSA